MEYGDFLQCVQEYAKKETGRGGVVSINHVIKNNGCELDGLVIMEEGKHISPTIYLNGFYKQYQNGRTVAGRAPRSFRRAPGSYRPRNR